MLPWVPGLVFLCTAVSVGPSRKPWICSACVVLLPYGTPVCWRSVCAVLRSTSGRPTSGCSSCPSLPLGPWRCTSSAMPTITSAFSWRRVRGSAWPSTSSGRPRGDGIIGWSTCVRSSRSGIRIRPGWSSCSPSTCPPPGWIPRRRPTAGCGSRAPAIRSAGRLASAWRRRPWPRRSCSARPVPIGIVLSRRKPQIPQQLLLRSATCPAGRS